MIPSSFSCGERLLCGFARTSTTLRVSPRASLTDTSVDVGTSVTPETSRPSLFNAISGTVTVKPFDCPLRLMCPTMCTI